MSVSGRISISIKLFYTLFLCILVPYYWVTYGPQNFLWLCDVALLLTLAALWCESSFLASTQAVAITLPQTLWVADFLMGFAGLHPIGIAAYMFDPRIPLFVRGLSLFHGWLPFLLLWLVWKLGYDRRSFLAQTLFGWALFLVSYAFDLRDSAGESINWVMGIGGKPQTWMPPWLYLFLLLVFFPLCIYLPTHLVFRRIKVFHIGNLGKS